MRNGAACAIERDVEKGHNRPGLARPAGSRLLRVRYRFDLETTTGIESRTELCEECRLLGLIGAPEQAESFVSLVTQVMAALLPRIEAEGEARAEALSAAHQRVRSASRRKGIRTKVKAHTPADVLGIYVLLPVSGGAA